MSEVTRRDLLKGSLAVCASTAVSVPERLHAAALQAATGTVPTSGNATAGVREKTLLDPSWRFCFGNADEPEKDLGFGGPAREGVFAKTGHVVQDAAKLNYDDSDWQAIDLPHDWAVALPFEQGKFLPERGAKPVGRDYPGTSIGWYRREFSLWPGDAGKRITLLFDGVFRHAMVLVNGIYMGQTESGYPPYSFDVTDVVKTDGPNTLLVRVDATLGEGWFYEGAGIYRHVWLMKTGPVYLGEWSAVVRTAMEGPSARLALECEAVNRTDADAMCGFAVKVLDAEGAVVASGASPKRKVAPGETATLETTALLKDAKLWSVEEPNLYRAVFSLLQDGTAADDDTVTFGVRTIRFDADQGFFLNGNPVKIKGTCNHQDHAGVGLALPDRLQYFRLERLKEMGSNACRTSHNPPTPEFLEACDAVGMMAMVETRMMASCPEGLSQLSKMVRRFRNHPSVVIWSLGNEEPLQGTPTGRNMVSTMHNLAKKLDPTRPCTVAMNNSWGEGISAVLDVQGCNYNLSKIDDFHRKFPKQPMIGTETASTVSTRGIYQNDPMRGYVSAYDVNSPPWAERAEEWWSFYADRPFLSGGFVWTGFDYRGEPTPYGWPCISSHFGVIDTCGFPKDMYYYYQTWWSGKPVLHLFPHWNWRGREGQEIDVWCYSNLDSVELLLNGKSLGTQTVKKNSHVAWKVPYKEGVIEARARKDGQVVMTEKRETTGKAAALMLHPDRAKIAADGRDVSVVRVEVVDAQGRIVPTADNLVEFAIEGPGRVIGVGNGDPSCHEPDKASKRSAFNGLCVAIVQSLPEKNGTMTVKATSPVLGTATAAVIVS